MEVSEVAAVVAEIVVVSEVAVVVVEIVVVSVEAVVAAEIVVVFVEEEHPVDAVVVDVVHQVVQRKSLSSHIDTLAYLLLVVKKMIFF